jgi:hypothetical protein
VKVTDSAGGSGTQAFSLTVTGGPSITTASPLAQGEVGAPYSQQLIATGGSGGNTWSLTNSTSLPQGLGLNSGTGAISGTPTAAGPVNFTVKVTDGSGGSDTQAFSITILAGPTITTAPTLPNGTVGAQYTAVTLTASGGTPPYGTWSISQGALPAGLNLASGSGTISGMPTSAGPSNFTVQVTDAKGVAGSKQFSITVASGLTIVTAPTLPNGSVGIAYSKTLSAAGGTPPYSWAVIAGSTGALTLNSQGNLSGTPASPGTLNFTVQVTDKDSVTASKQFTLTIASGLTITTPPALSSGAVGAAYSVTLNASGGTTPYTWSITNG